jgi:proline dehydrogenase
MNGYLRSALRACWAPLSERIARAYVAGPALADALDTCRGLSGAGIASILGFWDGPDDAPRAVADQYLAALRAVGRERLDCYASIKAPALGLSAGLAAEVLREGRRLDVRVHFDTLGPATVSPTFALVERALPAAGPVGVTLPGRWRRSPDDARRASDLGLAVRVVKGQEADPGREVEPRAGCLAVVDALAGRARTVAVASHDAALAGDALARLRAAGTPCELELLFGLPMRRALRAARAAGVPVRIYVPYGHAWLPYLLSRVRDNPAVLWWAARDLVQGRALRLPRAAAAAGVSRAGRA